MNKFIATETSKLEALFLKNHNEVFQHTDCLTCANCCKNYSPIIEPEEISNLARAINIEPKVLFDEYIEMDEDGDFVFRYQPCPMLELHDNRCKIYDDRPKACREYPHTNMKGIKNHLDLLEKNIEICPAAEEIVSRVLNQLDHVKS